MSGAPPQPSSGPPTITQPGKRSHPAVGDADHCAAVRIRIFTSHKPARFVWHHIQPQATGGQTTAENLVSLCDNCHYAVHAVLWALAKGLPVPAGMSRAVLSYARQGFDAATEAGTADKIPHEA